MQFIFIFAIKKKKKYSEIQKHLNSYVQFTRSVKNFIRQANYCLNKANGSEGGELIGTLLQRFGTLTQHTKKRASLTLLKSYRKQIE